MCVCARVSECVCVCDSYQRENENRRKELKVIQNGFNILVPHENLIRSFEPAKNGGTIRVYKVVSAPNGLLALHKRSSCE